MERIRIEGERVTVRPLRLDELDATMTAREAAAAAGTLLARPDRAKLRQRIETSGLLVDRATLLAIDIGGARAGEIMTYVPPVRALAAGAYEVGIGIDDPGLRGRGYGREAVQLLVDWLFDHGDATSVNLATSETNTAMRRVAEQLGFAAEGTVNDSGVESVLYVVTRDAWQALRRSRSARRR